MSTIIERMIEKARFGIVRGAGGYNMGEVDAFLDSIAERANGNTLTRGFIENANFSSGGMRGGYVARDVDSLLKEVILVLENPNVQEAEKYRQEIREKQTGGIKKQKGFFSRLFE